ITRDDGPGEPIPLVAFLPHPARRLQHDLRRLARPQAVLRRARGGHGSRLLILGCVRHANSMAPGADTLRRVLPRCSIFLLSPLLRTLFDVLTATLGGILAVLVAALFPSRVTHLFHGVVPSILPSV